MTGPAKWRRWRGWPDVLAVCGYLVLAGYVTERMWRFLDRYLLQTNTTDQIQFEYFLVHAVRVVTHGENPFYTTTMNHPSGVNLMANTATLGLHLPLVPVTMLFGPQVSFAVMVTGALAGTAAAWYWLFSRHLVGSRFAAFVAGGFCGFAPGMVSQADGHPNIAAQFLVPIIVWRVLRLREPGHALRNGLILGLLVTYQAFINEEILLLTALAAGLFVGVCALHDKAVARSALPAFLRALGVAGLVALALLAYPLWFQFFGPQHYRGQWAGAVRYGTDVLSFTGFSRASFSGYPASAARLSPNPSEQNAFLGWPLLVLVVFLAYHYRDRVVVRAALVAGLTMTVLSLGPRLQIHGKHTHWPGPFAPLYHLPVFDSVIATRLVLCLIPVLGLLLALYLHDAMTAISGGRAQVWSSRLVALGLVVAALLPVAPTPLPVSARPPVPGFFASDRWRAYVPPGSSVVTVPVAGLLDGMDGMRWSVRRNLEIPLVGGYFLGPDGSGRGMFGAPKRRFTALVDEVTVSKGKVPAMTDADRAAVREDLRFWKAAIVVMPPLRQYQEQMRTVAVTLLGFEPQWIDGVWVWDVRPMSG